MISGQFPNIRTDPKKRLVNIFAIIILAVFASACVIGFAACASDGDDMTDEDAAALYAALVKTDEYEGSFTLVNTESGSSVETEKEDGVTYTDKEDGTATYTYSFDSDSGYLVDMDDETESWSYGGSSEESLYKRYRYYVPAGGDALTLYTYVYDSDKDVKETKTKEDTSYSADHYAKNTSLSYNACLDELYGSKPWTTVGEMEDDIFGGDDGAVEFKKGKKETVYRFIVSESESSAFGTSSWEEKAETVLEFRVNSDGYVSYYSITYTWSEIENSDGYYWSEEDKSVGEYEISFSFDSKLKLAEKDMADYE